MNRTRKSLCQLVIWIMMLAACSGSLHAQNLTGEIDGTVKDPSGALVAGAAVTIRNVDLNTVERTLTTGTAGEFSAPQLHTGNYSVTVQRPGFQTVVHLVEVHVNQPVPLLVTLALGTASETVTVSTSANTPETQATISQTLITGTEAKELPLSSRNYEQMFLLQPGISGAVPGTVDRGILTVAGTLNTATYSINGQQSTQNGYYVDGADMENHGGNGQSGLFPSIDAIEESSYIRNSYGAQYGGEGGGLILVQTRSGSRDFHGGLYGFFRTQAVNANGYFNNLGHIRQPPYRYADFGYTIGGPLWIPDVQSRQKTSTFFFLSQEFLRSEQSPTVTLTGIPTADQRNGIFTAPVCVAYTGTTCTSSTTHITNFDSEAQAYLTDIIDKTPLPNSPTDPQGYIYAPPNIENETQTLVRVDHQFNSKFSVFFRFLNDPFHLVLAHGILQASGVNGVGNSTAETGGTGYLGHFTYTVSPSTILEGGYAHQSVWLDAMPTGLITRENSPDIKPTLPYASTLDRVPNLTVGAAYSSYGPFHNPYSQQQVFGNLTHTTAKHTIYAGGQYEYMLYQTNIGTLNAGAFTFTSSGVPAGSAATTFMQSFAQFLVGNVSLFQQASVDAGASFNAATYEAYLQDDYRITPRLTLNVGVRYLYVQQPEAVLFNGRNVTLQNFGPQFFNPANQPKIGSNGQICTVSPCAGGGSPNPSYNPLNGIIVAGQNSPFGDAVSQSPKLNVAPRVGLSWDVFGNGATAVRAAYGIYDIINTPGIFAAQSEYTPPAVFNASAAGVPFSNPAVGVSPTSPAPTFIYAAHTYQKTPYMQLYSLDVQQATWKGGLFDLGYYGDHELHMIGTEDINQPMPGAYATSGLIAGNKVTQANTVDLNSLRPYPGWGAINFYAPIFMANYNSLQAVFTQRFLRRSVFNANYTYSRGFTNSLTDSGSSPQYYGDLSDMYRPSLFNRNNVFSARLTYDFPEFRTRNMIVREMAGGWETSIIMYAGSGLYQTETTQAVDPAGIALLASGTTAINLPDRVDDPNRNAPHKQTQWFNTTAFVNVPAGQYRIGNSRPGTIIGPGYQDWDVSVYKNFFLPHSGVFQLRTEAFNVFNHTNFTTIVSTLGLTNNGQATAAGQARVLQFAAKLNF